MLKIQMVWKISTNFKVLKEEIMHDNVPTPIQRKNQVKLAEERADENYVINNSCGCGL